MSYRKHLMTSDEPPSELYKATELSTNLAEVGTDVPDNNVVELISKEQAIDTLTEYGNGRAVFISVGEAVIRIEQLPPAEPKIIRCKDCKHWDTTWTNDFSPNYHYCPMVDGVRKEDWFCADAERRTDE